MRVYALSDSPHANVGKCEFMVFLLFHFKMWIIIRIYQNSVNCALLLLSHAYSVNILFSFAAFA